MEIEYVPLEKLILLPDNVKHHGEADINNLATSLAEYGWKQPLVIDESFTVYVGNGRLLAARKLGMKEAPCVVADDLTPDKLMAFAIMDNRASELSTWDPENLKKAITEIKLDLDNLSSIGFNLEELEFYTGPIQPIEGLSPPPLAPGADPGGSTGPDPSMPPRMQITVICDYEDREPLRKRIEQLVDSLGMKDVKVK